MTLCNSTKNHEAPCFGNVCFSRFEQMCGAARLWGGVHFSDAVEEGLRIGRDVAKFATRFARLHIDPQGDYLSPDGPVVGPLARLISENRLA